MHYLSDVEAIDVFGKKIELLRKEIAKVIIGQDEVVKDVLISIFSKGHVLLVGVPGLAKTLLVNTISKVLGLSYSRIQFTPDLMPSDIIGTEILDQSRNFKFIKGPVFANIILADEINRTPPKTQSALLEAMQEKAITVAGKHYQLAKESRTVLKEREADLKSKKVELKDIVAETEKEENTLLKKSEMYSKMIEDRLLIAYQRIRKNARNGLAVVQIERDACNGCFNKIPPQHQLDIKMHKKIIVCEYCGRILVDDNIANQVKLEL
jgi:replication-associated recombination protein RarA